MSGGRGPQRPSGLFGRGGFFSEFANDPFFAGFGGFFQDPWSSGGSQQQQQRDSSRMTSAREIPIEGPSDDEGEPAMQHRLTGPLIHELPDHEEHMHQDLIFSPSQPDSVEEPEEPGAAPFLQHSHPPQQEQQQQQRQQQQGGDPLASMGTGPPPHVPSPPRPAPGPLPPLRAGRAPPGGGPAPPAGTGGLAAGEEPGSPLLVHLAEGMVLSEGSPRFTARSPRIAEQQEVPHAWGPRSSSGFGSQAAGARQQQPDAPHGPPSPAEWFGGGAAPKQQQRRRQRQQQGRSTAADEPGGFFVSTPTAQAPSAGVPFSSSPPLGASEPLAAGAAAAPIAAGPPTPSLFWTEPAAEAKARASGGTRTRAGSAPPAGPAAEPSGAAAAAGRRQRRPSSRTLSAQEAQAEAVEAVERTSRRRGRQQRQAHWERGDGSLFGAAADEAWEDHEMGEQPHEDPDWRPGQGQQRAGSAPVPKRSRHSAAAKH
ncbi:hypothetical protein ABPG77_002191 [Micractinium sp. CCAP 211/92]